MSAKEDKGTPQHFLSTFLSQPATSIPKGAQWAVFFTNLETSILPAITEAYKYEPNSWQTEAAAKVVLNKKYQQTKGCLFCQAIDIPGEGSVATAGAGNIKSNHYIRSFVGAGRNDFSEMRMTFLDTNISFCDSFLRGWALATATYGLIARAGVHNYRTNLTCYKYGITPDGPVIIQEVTFYGICCTSVTNEEYNYQPKTSALEREARFIYHNYSINTVTDNKFTSL